MNQIKSAAEQIKLGFLVAFPTESVYGLGADATNPAAVEKIFKLKGRPATNPIIVHVDSLDRAKSLFKEYNPIVEKLGQAFWPGPLTIVSQAADLIAPNVTANTGYVGVRIPNSQVARDLITLADLPIAAPSANKSGHISPTSAQDVAQEFPGASLTILSENPDIKECSVGIESTVVKIVGQSVSICRPGMITAAEIAKIVPVVKSSEEIIVSPGQDVRHYAPNDKITYLLVRDLPQDLLSKAILLDFAGKFVNSSNSCLAYCDLSPRGCFIQAANKLFSLLRWAESIPGKYLLLTDVPHLAIHNRLQRAASGLTI